MLAHRLRRRPNIVPTLGERLVFAGKVGHHEGRSGIRNGWNHEEM